MKIADIRGCANEIQVTQYRRLTSGLVGATVGFSFTPDWDGLRKTVVFKTRKTELDVILMDGGEVEIPWEICNTAGLEARVGVYGAQGEELRIPTIWGSLGEVLRGANPTGRPSTPPTPSWTDQIEAAVKTAIDTAQDVERRADEGDFDGGYYTVTASADGQTLVLTWTPSKEGMAAIPEQRVLLDIPGADPDDIAKAVADYLAAHPVEAPVTSVNNKTGAVVLTAADLFRTGSGLLLQDGVLSVDTADTVEQDNTLPVTSAAVYVEVGNIDALLSQI